MTDTKQEFSVRLKPTVTIFFSVMAIVFLFLTVANSAQELIHPIMMVVMLYGAYDSYRKKYFSVDFETRKFTQGSLIGPFKKTESFDDMFVKDDKIFMKAKNSEKSLPYSKMICDEDDYQSLLETVKGNDG
jgi:hypothetical protein